MLYFSNVKNDQYNNFFESPSDDVNNLKKYDYMMALFRDAEGREGSRAVLHNTLPTFVRSDMLFIDIDDGMTVEQFIELYNTLAYTLITSRNHQKEKGGKTCDRFHVLFPIEKLTDVTRYDSMLQWAIGYFGGDPACKNANRIFFGSPEDARIEVNEGVCVDTLYGMAHATEIKGDYTKGAYLPPDGPLDDGRKQELVKYAGSIRRQYIGDDAGLENALREHADTYCPGLSNHKFKSVLRSAIKYNRADEKEKAESGHRYRLTDIGSSMYLRDFMKGRFRWCADHKMWWYYEGGVWKKDNMMRAQKLTRAAMIAWGGDAKKIKDDGIRQAFLKHMARMSGADARERVLKDARALLPVSPDHFDNQKNLLNFKNGTLNLENGDFYEHDKTEYHTKQIECEYNEDAQPSNEWRAFIDTIFQSDAKKIDYVQKLFGMSLAGKNKNQIFLILHGKGGNGKSQLISVFQKLFGNYTHSLGAEKIMDSKMGVTNNDPYLAQLRNVRALFCTESKEGATLDTALVKKLTDEQMKITAAQKYQAPESFVLECVPFLITNHRPMIKDNGEAVWRRLRLISFDYQVPEEKRVLDYANVLLESGRAGIVNWFVEGYRRYQREGLSEPESVRRSTNEYKAEQDEIQQFLDEMCEAVSGERVKSTDLVKAYDVWKGYRRQTGCKWFNPKIEEKGFEKVIVNHVTYFIGLKLKESETYEDNKKNPFDENNP